MLLCCYARFLSSEIFEPGRSGLFHMAVHSLGGRKSEQNRLKISTRRRHFGERNRPFAQWLYYPAWIVGFTTLLNRFVLTADTILLSKVNRNVSLISDIQVKSQRGSTSRMNIVRFARRAVMQSWVISILEFSRVFTVVPRKQRLISLAVVPRT